jgi:hypothetical protein
MRCRLASEDAANQNLKLSSLNFSQIKEYSLSKRILRIKWLCEGLALKKKNEMKKIAKRITYIILVLVTLVGIYSCIPRVWYKKSTYGTKLVKSNILPVPLEDRLKKYITDTANNAQSFVVIKNEQILLIVTQRERV